LRYNENKQKNLKHCNRPIVRQQCEHNIPWQAANSAFYLIFIVLTVAQIMTNMRVL